MQQAYPPRPLQLPGSALGTSVPATQIDRLTLTVHGDMASVETAWRALEGDGVRAIYQRFDWLAAWCEHVAPAQGIEPRIVLATDGSRPVFLLPVGIRPRLLGRIAVWLGGTHVNSAMPIFDRAFSEGLTPDDTRRLFHRSLAALGRIDYAHLCSQPEIWQGIANPFAALPGRVTDQPILTISLEPDFNGVLARSNGAKKRKKLRWQENTLAPVGGYRFAKAATEAEALRFLDAFLGQKQEQFARSGVDNVFAEPGAVAFFQGLIARSFARGEPLIELYGVEIEGKVRATFAAGVDRDRFQGYFSAISLDEYQRVSPGELLLIHLMRQCCDRRCRTLDFGIGEERYKASWDGQPQPQFATYVGVTLRGKLVAGGLRRLQMLRIWIRGNPTAWKAVKKTRRMVARLRGRSTEAA